MRLTTAIPTGHADLACQLAVALEQPGGGAVRALYCGADGGRRSGSPNAWPMVAAGRQVSSADTASEKRAEAAA
jgi:hypothetical protein